MTRTRYAVPTGIVAMILALAACGSGAQGDSPPHKLKHATTAYHLVWSRQLAVNADSAATLDASVKLSNGTTATVAYVLAGNNDNDCDPGNPVHAATTYAYALSGRLLWKKSTSGQGRCTTSAPAVWRSWVYSPGLDGRIHRYAATTGREWKKNGWPRPFTKQPYVEKASAALVVSGNYLYVTTSGFDGDAGHYEGHVVTVNLRTNHANVWNSLCSNIHALINNRPGTPDYCPEAQAGMFGRGQGVIDPLNKDVYVVTGNGPWNGRTDWGDSILKLNPAGSTLLDAFTPTDQAYLNNQDLDLGSTSPAILPPIRAGGKTWHLMTQAGKGPDSSSGGPAVVWLVNRDQMGSGKGPGHLGGQLGDILHTRRRSGADGAGGLGQPAGQAHRHLRRWQRRDRLQHSHVREQTPVGSRLELRQRRDHAGCRPQYPLSSQERRAGHLQPGQRQPDLVEQQQRCRRHDWRPALGVPGRLGQLGADDRRIRQALRLQALEPGSLNPPPERRPRPT